MSFLYRETDLLWIGSLKQHFHYISWVKPRSGGVLEARRWKGKHVSLDAQNKLYLREAFAALLHWCNSINHQWRVQFWWYWGTDLSQLSLFIHLPSWIFFYPGLPFSLSAFLSIYVFIFLMRFWQKAGGRGAGLCFCCGVLNVLAWLVAILMDAISSTCCWVSGNFWYFFKFVHFVGQINHYTSFLAFSLFGS